MFFLFLTLLLVWNAPANSTALRFVFVVLSTSVHLVTTVVCFHSSSFYVWWLATGLLLADDQCCLLPPAPAHVIAVTRGSFDADCWCYLQFPHRVPHSLQLSLPCARRHHFVWRHMESECLTRDRVKPNVLNRCCAKSESEHLFLARTSSNYCWTFLYFTFLPSTHSGISEYWFPLFINCFTL